jgi:hypothetical protein
MVEAMKAELLFHQRIDYDDGAIVEMVLWRVPSSVPPSTHGLKYSLFYGRPGFGRSDTTTNAARATIGIFRAPRRPMRSAVSSN